MRKLFLAALAFGWGTIGAGQAGATTLADSGGGEAVATTVEIASSSSASVASMDAAPDESGDWNVAFTPYLWVAGMNGDIGLPRGDEVEVDKSFADILGDLKFAFMGALDVEHDRFVFLGDLIYLHVGAEVESIQAPGFIEGKVDSATLVSTAALGYRIVDNGPMFVDLFAGGRIVALDVETELTGPLQTRERDASKTTVAPLFGGRVRVPLGDKWGLLLYGDAGGFAASDVKWQLVGTVQRDLGKHWRLVAGYRHLQLHHDKEDLEFDVALSGPILGFTYRF